MKKQAELGDFVKDTITGFTGIVVGKHDYLQGCTRMTVQPKIDKDNKLPGIETFDQLQLKIITSKMVQKQAIEKDPGGPEKYSDIRHY